MKSNLDELQTRILGRISAAAQAGKVEDVTRLSSLVARTKELMVASQRLESEITEISSLVDRANGAPALLTNLVEQSPPPRHLNLHRRGRRENTGIEISIDWSKNGQPYGTETIREHFASDSLVRLMQRLNEVLGLRPLEVASAFQINRGPFVSRNPSVDYVNQASGGRFTSHEIPGTDYSVLTHSETDQKVEDVQNFLKAIGLIPGSYLVKKVAR